jgi:hypothetical protein
MTLTWLRGHYLGFVLSLPVWRRIDDMVSKIGGPLS